jgi:uncharacterized protein (UPF0332 family)
MKIKTVRVDRPYYKNYLKKSKECLMAAKRSLELKEWNAATIAAIHAAITAADALCVYFLGQRHAGERHADAVMLFNTIGLEKEELNQNARRISRIMGIKNMAEYEERLIYQSEAEGAVVDAERLLAFVHSKIPL